MKRNTEKNRELLAKEAYDQMDLDNVEEMLRDQLETYYESLSPEEFNEVWVETFGED